MAGPDLGRCFFTNLRVGMYLAWLLQAGMVGYFSYMTLEYYLHPGMDLFFYFKGVLMNTGSVVYIGTGALCLVAGLATLVIRPDGSPRARRAAYQSARLWMWLTVAMVPIQLYYGGYLSFKCVWLMRKLTPSLIITDLAFQAAFHGEKGGAGMMMQLLNPGRSKQQAEDDREETQFKGSIDRLDDPERFEPVVKKETESKLGGFAKSVFHWLNKYKRPVGLFVVVVTALILSAVFHETQWIKGLLPYPMNYLYGMGINFLVTFLIYAWMPAILHGAIAIHVAAYQAVLGRGGVGDEFVGWKRLRWFYAQSPARRREIRAGARPEELRRRTLDWEYPDSEDSTSGSEFEEIIEDDLETIVQVVDQVERSHRRPA